MGSSGPDSVDSQLSDRERELLARLHEELASRERLEADAPDARSDLHDALIVACDIYTWRLLRLDVGHTASDVKRIVVRMIRAILAR